VAHEWKSIEGLPGDSLSDGELGYLSQIWDDVRREAENTEKIATLMDRLKREWSIETGFIEGIYTLDVGTTQTLIERGFQVDLIQRDATNLAPELLLQILNDQEDALEMVFAHVKAERPLTVGFIKDVHAALVKSQETYKAKDSLGNAVERPLEAGKFKTLPNNVIEPSGQEFYYCPPVHVDAEMDRLVAMYCEAQERPPEEVAAWLHHRFVLIHPFPDGNGRVARCLASMVFAKHGLFPVTIRRGEERGRYIDCLKSADAGNLRPLIDLFVEVQRDAIMQASRIAGEL